MLGSAAAAPIAMGAAPAAAPIERALVLSGGGARGAYEAGIIGSMVAGQRISDGMPLAPYGIVCGTSIGALNGWFVATGQYSALKELWYGVSAAHLIRLKRKFAALRNPKAALEIAPFPRSISVRWPRTMSQLWTRRRCSTGSRRTSTRRNRCSCRWFGSQRT